MNFEVEDFYRQLYQSVGDTVLKYGFTWVRIFLKKSIIRENCLVKFR